MTIDRKLVAALTPATVSGTARKVFALLDRLSEEDRHRVISAVVALYTPRERVDGTA